MTVFHPGRRLVLSCSLIALCLSHGTAREVKAIWRLDTLPIESGTIAFEPYRTHSTPGFGCSISGGTGYSLIDGPSSPDSAKALYCSDENSRLTITTVAPGASYAQTFVLRFQQRSRVHGQRILLGSPPGPHAVVTYPWPDSTFVVDFIGNEAHCLIMDCEANPHRSSSPLIPRIWQTLSLQLVRNIDRYSLSMFLDGTHVSTHTASGLSFDPTSVVVTGFEGIADVAVYEGSGAGMQPVFTAAEIDQLFNWHADESAGCTGSIHIPTVVYQIVYDPPGDGSTASFDTSTTYSTSLSTNMTTDGSVSIGMGYEYENELFGIGASFGLSTTSGWSASEGNELAVSLTDSREIVSSSLSDSAYIGPGHGDMIVYQSVDLIWRLWSRPKLGEIAPDGSPEQYDYMIGYRPDPEATGVIERRTITKFLEEYRNDTALTNLVVSASAIDPRTGRVRRELVADGRLRKIETQSFSGGIGSSFSRQSVLSRTITYAYSRSLSAEAHAKLKAGGYYVETAVSIGFTMGASSVSAREQTRNWSFSLGDDEGWDRHRFDLYEDLATGAMVFDPLPDSSFSSFPRERNTRPAVDWRITPTDTLLTGTVGGEDAIVPLTVSNVSTTDDAMISTLRVRAEISSYPRAGAHIDPASTDVARGEPRVFTLTLPAATAPATDTAVVRFTLEKPDGSDSYSTEVRQIVKWKESNDVRRASGPMAARPAAIEVHGGRILLSSGAYKRARARIYSVQGALVASLAVGPTPQLWPVHGQRRGSFIVKLRTPDRELCRRVVAVGQSRGGGF